jgi:hypothetical protein
LSSKGNYIDRSREIKVALSKKSLKTLSATPNWLIEATIGTYAQLVEGGSWNMELDLELLACQLEKLV